MAEQAADKTGAAQNEQQQPDAPVILPGRQFAALAPLYSFITSARNRLYDSGLLIGYSSALPVICVGNATAGGSGKSPVAAALAAMLAAAGRKPVILSRGYGGSVRGPKIVSAADSPDEVGDEPLMHLRFLNPGVPVVISRDRVVGAAVIAERRLGETIILDDGYQHRRLKRDLNLLLIDISSDEAVAEWKAGRILPAGRFREKPEQALKRAGAVLFVTRSSAGAAERRAAAAASVNQIRSGLPQFGVELYPEKFLELFSGAELPLEALRGVNGAAVCGLAKPEYFFRSLRELGIELTTCKSFSDHHPYSKAELQKLLNPERPLFVTAKDAVKLAPFLSAADSTSVSPPPSFGFSAGLKVYVLRQGVRFASAEEEQVLSRLLGAAADRGRPAA